MIVYHGSNFVVERPRILTTEVGRDFGFGFYTTDIEEQAVRWAQRKARLGERLGQNGRAVLNKFEFDRSATESKLNVAVFETPSLEWLDFIVRCRSDIGYKHEYDLVIGKIADDNVGETVSFVMSGIMRREDAVERLKFQKINNQICFNTEKALGHLRFLESVEV